MKYLFEKGNLVKVKSWEQLKEEYGLIDVEEIKTQLREDETCYFSDEEIDNYNEEVINIPFGIKESLLKELSKKCYKVHGYDSELEEILLEDEQFSFLVSQELFELIPEEEIMDYMFWLKDNGAEIPFNSLGCLKDLIYLEDQHKYFLDNQITGGKADCLLYSSFYIGVIQSLLKQDNPSVGLSAISMAFKEKTGLYSIENFKDFQGFLISRVEGEIDKASFENDNVTITLEPLGEASTILAVVQNKENMRHTHILVKEDIQNNFNLYIELFEALNIVFEGQMDSVVEAVKRRDRDEAVKALSEIIDAKRSEYSSIKTEINIKKFAAKAGEQEKVLVERQIERARTEIRETEHCLRKYNKQLRELQERLFGIQYMGGDLKKVERALLGIAEDFLNFTYSADRLRFCLVQPLLFWDDKCYENLTNSNYFEEQAERNNASIDVTLFKNVVDKIFVTREYVVYFAQGVDFRMPPGEAMLVTVYTDDETRDEQNLYIPNPHLERFNCWGENGPLINKALAAGDYLTAFEQVRSAIAGLSLYDTAVMDAFVYYLTNTFFEKNCLMTNDGTMISVKEAIEREEKGE